MRPTIITRLGLALAGLLAAAGTAPAQFGVDAWFRAEALRWQVTDAPLPFPLVTAGDPFGPNTLSEPGTVPLLGGRPVGLGTGNGGRFTAGAWLDGDEVVAGEISGFYLDRRTAAQAFADPTGAAGLGLPYLSGLTGAPTVFPLAFPPSITPPRTIFIPQEEREIVIPGTTIPGAGGQARFVTHSEMFGFEGNALLTVSRDFLGDVGVFGLAGVRYLQLDEGLVLEADSRTLPEVVGEVFTSRDSFTTRNVFYGPQIGVRLAFDPGTIFADLTAKFAAGPMTQSVSVDGMLLTNRLPPGTLSLFPSGVYAQRTNTGTSQVTTFATVSELQANGGVQLTGFLRVVAGYSFLYVTGVARPGDQIDPFLNPNQSEALLLTPGPPGLNGGAPVPQRTVSSSNFWASGWSLGVELRY